MPKQLSSVAKMLEPGEKPSFTVSAQTPIRIKPGAVKGMFVPVMRLAPDFQSYSTYSPPPSKSRSTTKDVYRPADPVKETIGASLTFITNEPGQPAIEPPAKRRKIADGRTKPSTYRFSNKKPMFNVHRPLKNAEDIHKDVWTLVFQFCHPRFLLRAKTVSQNFYTILQQQSLWKESRRLHLRPEIRDRPDGITEQQYADLLVGRGCQNTSCAKEGTTSVCWAFLVRLCPECIQSKTTRVSDLDENRRHILPNDKPLSDALPMISCMQVHRHDVRKVRRDASGELAYLAHGRASSYRFLRSAYDALEVEYLALQTQGTSDQELITWWKGKYDATMLLMEQRLDISNGPSQVEEGPGCVREDRRAFFVEMAKQLDPPMPESVLDCLAAYKKALLSHNKPTERAWETLKPKILPFREQAERLEKELNPRQSTASESFGVDSPARVCDRLHRHRCGSRNDPPTFKPEQEIILGLARQVFAASVDAEVSDSDLIIVTLQNVYTEYQKLHDKSEGLNYDGHNGPYQLSLDDTKMIVKHVVEKDIWPRSGRGVRVFHSFKCPTCSTGKNRDRKFSFEKLFEHLLQDHGKAVGDGLEYWHYTLAERHLQEHTWHMVTEFPWYTVPWPRCLPILPEHQDPANLPQWNPDVALSYARDLTTEQSAFEGRSAITEQSNTSFIDLFEHAVKTLKGVRLDSATMMRIAFQYALDASRDGRIELPDLVDFVDAAPNLQQLNPAMDFSFRCGACMRTGEERASARHVKHNIHIKNLHQHWAKRHQNDIPKSPTRRRKAVMEDDDRDVRHWTEDFMHLPSDEQVFKEIQERDAALAAAKADVQSNNTSIKRKPKNKSTVILSTPLASQAFDQLFAKR